ncbi:MAG TPA: hypothetical protein VHB69_14590 [Mycobacteriales bacterium]|nr:hypothetical protein [Mycobacteriales bacterium]
MEPSTIDAVRATYGSRADEALALLERYGDEPWHREVDRVRRAVLTLAAGDLDKLRLRVETARRDYRDVLFNAEYR